MRGVELRLDVEGPPKQRSLLSALEARYPMLRWTIRDHVTQKRRPMLRFFACEEDLSHEPPDAPLRSRRDRSRFSLWGPLPAGRLTGMEVTR